MTKENSKSTKEVATKTKKQEKTTSYKAPQENNVDLSWSRYILPAIHPEGLKIVGCIFAIVLVLGLLSSYIWIIGLPIVLFAFYFFRNPTRVTPDNPNFLIAPADGIVSNIKYIVPPKELELGDEEMLRISIFMSVFNVHVNRTPITGEVKALHYRPGKFVNISDKDSEDNERQEIMIETNDGIKIGFIQIAGLVARRIFCPLQIGQKLKAGEIFGMIRFGSRLDVFLPKGVEPKVLLGQVSVAGETVLADLSSIRK